MPRICLSPVEIAIPLADDGLDVEIVLRESAARQ